MLENGVPFAVVASLAGWSASTTDAMIKRYGHIRATAHREAVESLDTTTTPTARENSTTAAESRVH